MPNNQSVKSTALRLLAKGLKTVPFNFWNHSAECLIKLCASGSMKGLRVQKLAGHIGTIYLLFFPNHIEMSGLVIRVVKNQSKTNVAGAVQEITFLKQLQSETTQYLFPHHLATFPSKNSVIFVTELLEGTMLTETVVGTSEAARVASAIRHTQRALSATKVGKAIIANAKTSPFSCASKLAGYVHTYFGIAIDIEELSFLKIIDDLREKSPVIVSDRSPTNFVINNEKIGAYDFEVAFAGVPFEDWSWFIDDPRLVSSLSRAKLLSIFCQDFALNTDKNETILTHLFHISSIYVCIKQSCFMLARGEKELSAKYLERAHESAQKLSLKEAVSIITRMRDTLPHKPSMQKT